MTEETPDRETQVNALLDALSTSSAGREREMLLLNLMEIVDPTNSGKINNVQFEVPGGNFGAIFVLTHWTAGTGLRGDENKKRILTTLRNFSQAA